MPTKCIVLPPNLVKDKKFAGHSIYRRDYCYRHRHARRATTPTVSYTSLLNKQKKLIGDMDRMQLSDHFTTYPAALSMGYTRNDFKSTLGNTKELRKLEQQVTQPEVIPTAVEDTEKKFFEDAPESLKKIEQAWLEEVDTGKRERGNLYGLAGKKMNLYPRKANDKMAHKKTKSLPGLDTWLSNANEYEKQVVHKFISKMSEAHHNPEPPRPQSSPAGLYLSGNQLAKPRVGGKHARINSRLISPKIDELTATGLVPKPPRTSPPAEAAVPSTPKTPPRCTESAQSNRSSNGEVVESNEVSTQLPPGSVKPSSPLYNVERPASVPASLGHTCQNCESCKKKMLKKLIDDLSGKELASYDELLEDKSRNLKSIYTQMYKPQPRAFLDDDDFLHHGCAFQNVLPPRKGHFTIHPEFVSENIVDLKKLRKKHEKYFGESKRPVL